jgi:diguanylate cyclase (GGDEF)-like protein
VGRHAPELSPAEDADVTRAPVAELRAGTRASVTVEKRFVRRDGAVRWATLTLSRLPLGDGRVGTLGVIGDVTERRALEARLAALSEHDELTGLLNRRGFARMAAQELKSAARTRRHDAVLYLDLDRIKRINDTYGHAAGDEALRGVAQVIGATVRDADFGGRLGGDEFVLYAVGLRPGDGQVVAARLRATLEAHNAAAVARGRPFPVECSVGVAELEHGDSLDTLLARGDAALYAQKAGRGG